MTRYSVRIAACLLLPLVAASCGKSAPPPAARNESRKYLLDRVDDAAVVQVYADGFSALPLKEKTLLWHLYQAAIAGRDIYYDQISAHGLEMREVIEAIVGHPEMVNPTRWPTSSATPRSSGSTAGRTTISPQKSSS